VENKQQKRKTCHQRVWGKCGKCHCCCCVATWANYIISRDRLSVVVAWRGRRLNLLSIPRGKSIYNILIFMYLYLCIWISSSKSSWSYSYIYFISSIFILNRIFTCIYWCIWYCNWRSIYIYRWYTINYNVNVYTSSIHPSDSSESYSFFVPYLWSCS